MPNSISHTSLPTAGSNKKTRSSEERPGFLNAALHGPPPKTYCEAYSGRFSGSRIILPLAPSHPETLQQGFGLSSAERSGLRVVDLASFVPDYSGVAVPDSHGVPLLGSSHLTTVIFYSLIS